MKLTWVGAGYGKFITVLLFCVIGFPYWPHILLQERQIEYEPHHNKTCLCHMRTTTVQISLRIRRLISAFVVGCPDSITISCYIQNFACFCCWAGKFKSNLAAQLWRHDGRQGGPQPPPPSPIPPLLSPIPPLPSPSSPLPSPQNISPSPTEKDRSPHHTTFHFSGWFIFNKNTKALRL